MKSKPLRLLVVPKVRPSSTFILLILYVSTCTDSASGLVTIVQQVCAIGSVFNPLPATVSNYCLQCFCLANNISFCKQVLIQLNPVCSGLLAAPTLFPFINPRLPGTVVGVPGQLPVQPIAGQQIAGQPLPGQPIPLGVPGTVGVPVPGAVGQVGVPGLPVQGAIPAVNAAVG